MYHITGVLAGSKREAEIGVVWKQGLLKRIQLLSILVQQKLSDSEYRATEELGDTKAQKGNCIRKEQRFTVGTFLKPCTIHKLSIYRGKERSQYITVFKMLAPEAFYAFAAITSQASHFDKSVILDGCTIIREPFCT